MPAPSNIITSGLGSPANLITGGLYDRDHRYEKPAVNSAIVLSGLLSSDQSDLILQGMGGNSIRDLFFKAVMEFDSPLNDEMVFASPLFNKDLIIRKYKLWI